MTLADAQAQLAAWEAASLSLAAGKEHRIGDRMIRLEDGAEVRNMIGFWQGRVNALAAAEAGRAGTAGYALADFSDE